MSPARILVVEDDEATRLLLATLLRKHRYETRVLADGRQALELLKQERFDLIILDLMMPTVGGADVLRLVQEENLDTPVLLCTAAGPNATNRYLSQVKAIVRKPFDIADLVETVAALTTPPEESS